MNKDEFLSRLSELLSDVNESEREEALKYYRDYFDEAGIFNEQNVINELISPENVAETIKQSLGDEAFYDNCEYGEKNSAAEHLELVNDSPEEDTGSRQDDEKNRGAYTASDNAGSDKKSGGLSTGAIVAIVIACILLSPIILSGAGTVLSTIASLIAVALVLTILIAICPFILTLGGFAAIVAGAIEFMSNASVGALIFGSGLIAIGVSLIGYVIFWLYFFKLLPGFFRWLAGLITKKGGKS